MPSEQHVSDDTDDVPCLPRKRLPGHAGTQPRCGGILHDVRDMSQDERHQLPGRDGPHLLPPRWQARAGGVFSLPREYRLHRHTARLRRLPSNPVRQDDLAEPPCCWIPPDVRRVSSRNRHDVEPGDVQSPIPNHLGSASPVVRHVSSDQQQLRGIHLPRLSRTRPHHDGCEASRTRWLPLRLSRLLQLPLQWTALGDPSWPRACCGAVPCLSPYS
jgi:hypothetical protein